MNRVGTMTRLSFSVLLNLLIDNIPDENGDKYSLSEISRQTGVSVNQLGHYRRGSHTNPTYENIVMMDWMKIMFSSNMMTILENPKLLLIIQ